MTDWLADSPVMAVMYCPGCETERDPTREVLDVRYCADHTPTTVGPDDPEVAQGWISGTAESGEGNKAWCDLLHRGAQA